jgi:hypothetical protein
MKSKKKELKDIYFDIQSFYLENNDFEPRKQSMDRESLTKATFSFENMTQNSPLPNKLLGSKHRSREPKPTSEVFIIIKENKKGFPSFQTPFNPISCFEEDFLSKVVNIKHFQKEIDEMKGSKCNIINKEIKQNKYPKEEKYRRKYSTDSQHKKIKRFFFLYLRWFCSETLKTTLPKIPNFVITNVTITFNKHVFDLDIRDFFKEFCKFSFFPNEKERNFDLKEEMLLTSKIKDFYSFYLNNQFEKDLNLLKRKESLMYLQIFKKRGINLIDYYSQLEPFKKKLNKLY